MSESLHPQSPVLLAAGSEELRGQVLAALQSGGISNVIPVLDGEEVLDLLGRREVGVALLQHDMSRLSGEELRPLIRLDWPDLPVIILSERADLTRAVHCIRMGAFDYLAPGLGPMGMLASVRRAVEVRELRNVQLLLKRRLISGQLERPEAFSAIVTANDRMHAIFGYVEAIAPTDAPVLISGETGVGKELVARATHA